MARRSSKSLKTSSGPDLFYHGEITFAPGKSGGLASLRESRIRTIYPGLREHHLRLTAASYFADSLSRLVEADAPAPDLFELLEKALLYLETHDPTWHLVERFERRAFHLLGLDDGQRPLAQLRHQWLSPPSAPFKLLKSGLPEA
jgi:recombinational DNA repair protein (RecF pathway)